MNELWQYILGGSIGLSLVEGIKAGVAYVVKRRDEKKDRAEEKEDKAAEEEARISKLEEAFEEMQTSQQTLLECQRYVLYDRLQYLSRKYLEQGDILIEDKTNFYNLHHAYENAGGNGDFDEVILPAIDKLPLRKG